MQEFISPEIECCRDEVLKQNALAAIQRGTRKDMNETYLACMNYNKKLKLQEMLEMRKAEFVRWKRWFASSS